MQINDYYAQVLPVGFKYAKNHDKAKAPQQEPKVNANFSMCPEDGEDQSSTTTCATTRFQEIKVGLEDEITSMVNEKFQQYDAKIQTLQQTVQQNKIDADEKHYKTQPDVHDIQKNQAVIQTQISDSNNPVVSQMQSLLQQMQENLNKRFDNMDGHGP